MITLGLLSWLRGTVNTGGLQEGDPVRVTLDSKNAKASEFDGLQGRIDEIIRNPDGKDGRLYKIEMVETKDTVFLNRDQFEVL